MDARSIATGLTPAMAVMLTQAATRADGTDGVLSGPRHTQAALVRRGLATPEYGRAEVPNYRYTGRCGSTRTVYDAYLGSWISDLGREVAAILAGKGD